MYECNDNATVVSIFLHYNQKTEGKIMKKNLLIMTCVCMLAVAFTACGKEEATTETSVAETVAEAAVATEQELAPVIQETEAATDAVVETVAETTAALDDEEDVYDPGMAGSWHEAIAGRAYMTVTAVENDGFAFDVTWPDSAFGYYTWTFTAYPNEAGVYYYSNGIVSYVEADENGNSTETVVTDSAHGNLAILLDGSMEWNEDGDEPATYSFVMD